MGTTKSRSPGKKRRASAAVRLEPWRPGFAQGDCYVFVRPSRGALPSRSDHHYGRYAASHDDCCDGSGKSGRSCVDRGSRILPGPADFWVRWGNGRPKGGGQGGNHYRTVIETTFAKNHLRHSISPISAGDDHEFVAKNGFNRFCARLRRIHF